VAFLHRAGDPSGADRGTMPYGTAGSDRLPADRESVSVPLSWSREGHGPGDTRDRSWSL